MAAARVLRNGALPRRLRVYGHSYSAGAGLSSPTTERVTARLAALFGGAETNLGVSSSCLMPHNGNSTGYATTGGWATIFQDHVPGTDMLGAPPFDACVVYHGLNDMSLVNTNSGIGTYYPPTLRAVVDRLRCGAVFEDSDASCAYSTSPAWGTLAGTTTESGSGIHQTTPAGSTGQTVTITVPSTYPGNRDIIIGTVTIPASGTVTASAVLDGGSPVTATYDATPTAINSPRTVRIPGAGIAAGSHTIVVTFTGQSTYAFFDWWGVEARRPPVILLPKINKIITAPWTGNEGAAYSGSIRERVDTVNGHMDTIAAEYADKLVITIPTEDLMEMSSANFAVDLVHPNAVGAQKIAQRIATLAAPIRNNESSRLGPMVPAGII